MPTFPGPHPTARPGTLRHERTRSHQERETAPGRMALTPANDGTKDGAGPGPLARYANGTVDNAGGLVTMDDHNLFEIIDTTRSMRRLKPDPIPDEVVERIIRAGTKAPSGQNTQPWAFLVVRDAAAKGFIQERYLEVMERAMGDRKPAPDERSRDSRGLRAAWHLASHLHETPVLLLVCGKRDWPFAIAHEDRKGLAPPAYGSTLPRGAEHSARLPSARPRRHAHHPAPNVRRRAARTFRYPGGLRGGGNDSHRLPERPFRARAAASGTGSHPSRSLGQSVAGLTRVRIAAWRSSGRTRAIFAAPSAALARAGH